MAKTTKKEEYIYSKEQLNLINKDSATLSIKLNDYNGNSTKHIGINKESLPHIVKFLTDYVKKANKVVKKEKKKIGIKCPYTYKSFERCPACYAWTNGAKVCTHCKKDVKELYMKNVKDGRFA